MAKEREADSVAETELRLQGLEAELVHLLSVSTATTWRQEQALAALIATFEAMCRRGLDNQNES